MSSKPILTVFGATGNQGGSVISTILSSSLKSKYTLRGITRDPTKPNAQALSSKGVELAQADLNDSKSIRSAIAGSHSVFAVTNYWDTEDKDVEISQGKSIVDACLAEGVTHLVWSALPNVTALTKGALKDVEHFDSKAAVREYAEEVKGDKLTVSYFMPGFFMSNMKSMIRQDEKGVFTLTQPWDEHSTHIPLLDPNHDTGKFVVGLLEKGKEANGAAAHAVSEWKTPGEVARELQEVSGSEAKFQEVPREVYKSFLPMSEKAKEELTQNMELVRDYSYYGKGTEKEQVQRENDQWLVQGAQKITWKEYVKREGLGKAQ